jgi:hypothetical protein
VAVEVVVVVDVVVEVEVDVLGSVVEDSVLVEVDVELGSLEEESVLDWVELESPSPLPAMTTTATIRPTMIASSAATR